MKVNVIQRKFECRNDIHYKTQTGTSCEKCNSEAIRLGIDLRFAFSLGLGVAFFPTGPGFVLIMYIITTLEFPMYNIVFHLLTASVNAKYCY